MNSFDVAAVVNELKSILPGMRIDNIYQLNSKIMLFRLKKPGGENVNLLIEAGVRIHITMYQLEKPKVPPVFAMALRKYLRNRTIRDVRQHEFERIVIIEIEGKDGVYNLICELFGEGNIILVSPEGLILHALKFKRMKDRDLIRGKKFRFPPSSGLNPRKLRRDDIFKLKEYDSLEIVKALTRFLSIGGLNSEEILKRAEVDKKEPCNSLTIKDLEAIFVNVKEYVEKIDKEIKPIIYIDENDGIIDYAPIPMVLYNHLKTATYKTFNRVLDEYYTRTSIETKVQEVLKKGEEEIGKMERILHKQREFLKMLREMSKMNMKRGNLIYMHLSELKNLLQRIMSNKRKGMTWKRISDEIIEEKNKGVIPAIYFHSIHPERMKITVEINGEKIDLDLKKTVQENARDYYDKAKKARKKIAGAKVAIKKIEEKIAKIKKNLTKQLKNTSRTPPKVKRKEWYEKFRWFFSSDGFLVIGGRDASTNEVLIRKYMEPQDIIFHADIVGAPFVLIKTNGKEIPEKTLKEAAQLAASYSRAWREGLASIDVYWVFPKQVSKAPPPGEYLLKGSYMIYGRKNFIKNVPLEISIGVKSSKSGLKVIGGPPDAIERNSIVYVRIVPGEETSGRLAKAIKKEIAEKSPDEIRREVYKISLDEIQKFIPYGRGKIKK